jgi:hypothetical protein
MTRLDENDVKSSKILSAKTFTEISKLLLVYYKIASSEDFLIKYFVRAIFPKTIPIANPNTRKLNTNNEHNNYLRSFHFL